MKIRRVIQLIVFVLVLTISIGHTLEESGISVPLLSTASLHAVCPFGGVVSIYEFFISGSYVKKIHESSFVLMLIIFGLTIVFGPVFCGWICPFGTFQEWISTIGKRIFGKRYNTFIPYKIDRYLRFIRYIVLVVVLIKTARSVELMFINIDPYYALFNIWTDDVAVTAYIALGITILISLFVERPFCKYFCPYGAVLGLFNLFKLSRITRKSSTCIGCRLCDKICPMNIPLSNVDVSRDHQCISCLECTSEVVCPRDETMVLSIGSKLLKGKVVGLATIGFFVIGIGGSMALNLWNTESSKIPTKYSTGEFAGKSNPADIRGSYTLMDVESAFDIPVDLLVEAFALGFVDNPNDFRIKELEEIYHNNGDIELGTDSVRLFVSLYKSLPFSPEEGTVLLKPAGSILKDLISIDKREWLITRLVDVPKELVLTSLDTDPELDISIRGMTTFQDLLDMGLTEDEIRYVVGSLPDNLNMSIRDYGMKNSIEFSIIKEKLLDQFK